MGHVGQVLGKHLYELIVQQIAFRNGQHPLLVEHFGVECGQFVQQYLIFFPDVLRVAGHHEQQQRVALDMTQET